MCKKTPIKKTSRIPKIICGIIIATFIAVVGYISLSAFWFWICWVFIGAGLVAIGCIGEWVLFINPAPESDEKLKSHHRHRELQFITAVAIGVTMDFIGLFHEMPEAIRLEQNVVDIGTTNAQLIASNLLVSQRVEELRQTNNALELQLKDWPLKQRVSEISVTLFLTVKGTNDDRLPAWGAYSNTVAYMTLCDNAVTYSNKFSPPITTGFDQLEAHDLEPVGMMNSSTSGLMSIDLISPLVNIERHGYIVRFQLPWDMTALNMSHGSEPSMTAGEAMGLIKGLRIDLKFLPHDAEILEGHAKVIVNNNNPSTTKVFDIPPQKALEDAGAFGVERDTKGFTCISTNWH